MGLPSKLSQLDTIEVAEPCLPNNKAKKRGGLALLEEQATQSDDRPTKTKRTRRRPAIRIPVDDIREDQAFSGIKMRSSLSPTEKDSRVSHGPDIFMPSCAKRSLSGEFVPLKRISLSEKDTSRSPTTMEGQPPMHTCPRVSHDAQQHCPQVSRSPMAPKPVLADITASSGKQAEASTTSFVTARKRKGRAKTIGTSDTDQEQTCEADLFSESKDLSPDQSDTKKQKSGQDDALSEQSPLSNASFTNGKSGELSEGFQRLLVFTDSPQLEKPKGKEGLHQQKNYERDTLSSIPVASLTDLTKNCDPPSDEEEFISGIIGRNTICQRQTDEGKAHNYAALYK